MQVSHLLHPSETPSTHPSHNLLLSPEAELSELCERPTCSELATLRCFDCEASFCEECFRQWHSLGTLKRHVAHPYSPHLMMISYRCGDHPSYLLENVCTESACPQKGSAICLRCEKERHSGHLIQSLADYANEQREEWKLHIQELSHQIDAANEIASLIDNRLRNVMASDPALDCAETQTRAYFAELQRALMQRETEVIEQLRTTSQQQCTELKQQRQRVSDYLEHAYEIFEEISTISLESDHLVFLAQRASALLSEPLVVAPSVVTPENIAVSFDPDFALRISSLGCVTPRQDSLCLSSSSSSSSSTSPPPSLRELRFARVSKNIRVWRKGLSISKNASFGWNANAQTSLPPAVGGVHSFAVQLGEACNNVMIGWAPVGLLLNSPQFKRGCFIYTFGGSRHGEFPSSPSTAFVMKMQEGLIIKSSYDRNKGIVSFEIDGKQADTFTHVSGELLPSFCLGSASASLALMNHL